MKTHKIWFITISIFIVGILLIIFLATQSIGKKLYSRKVMEETQMLVMEDMHSSPPEIAEIYAYVSTIYYNVLKNENSSQAAVVASTKFLNLIYPEQDQKYKIDKFLISLSIDPNYKLGTTTQEYLNQTLDTYTKNKENKYPYKRPLGKVYWSGESPLGIDILDRQPMLIKKDYLSTIPPPPAEGSQEQKDALKELAYQTKIKSLEQGALINYWSGMHMTPGTSGVWQNRFYNVVVNYRLSDEEYAKDQMLLAQTIYDTYLEVWKIKYKYWTKRPSTYSKEITLEMIDPNYPSYVSEYSAVSQSAYLLLSTLFPDGKNIWSQDFENASRIGAWAGCSFPYDETSGEELGQNIFNEINSNLKLNAIPYGYSFIPLKILTPKVLIYDRSEEAYKR